MESPGPNASVAAGWQIQLCTLAGRTANVELPPDAPLSSLATLAQERLGLDGRVMVSLCLGEELLGNHNLSLEAAGLRDKATVTIVVRRHIVFTRVMCPQDGLVTPEANMTLRALGDEDEALVMACFQQGFGYRAVIAEPLPATGRPTVAFDFHEYVTFMAVGVHRDPDEILRGPLDSYGWIGETPGGICLYEGYCVRQGGATLDEPKKGQFYKEMTVVMTVNHRDSVITWHVLPSPSGEGQATGLCFGEHLPDRCLRVILPPNKAQGVFDDGKRSSLVWAGSTHPGEVRLL